MNKDKLESQKQWNATPCGTGDYLEQILPNTLEYFESIKYNRYEVTDHWMKKNIPFNQFKGKKILEIGHGIGTDLVSFAENGSEVYGIDITKKHHDLATLNFKLRGLNSELKLCDAAAIDYQSQFFDVVYSNGVLHHTPDIEVCISEAHRVLKKNGIFILSMYYKYSAFHIFTKIIFEGILRGKLKRLGYKGLMATIEHGADGINIKPLVKTYSKREIKGVLKNFAHVDFKIAHLQKSHFSKLEKILPNRLIQKLEKIMGWYIIAFAIK